MYSLAYISGYIADVPPAWIVPNEPLSSLDLFAGCGGLSEGLHQVGLAETKWAVIFTEFYYGIIMWYQIIGRNITEKLFTIQSFK